MKKILLCTTALFGLIAGPVSATDDMKVTFAGMTKFEAFTKNQDKDHKAPLAISPNQESSSFFTSQKVSLKVEGKADSLTYGAVLRLQMIANGADKYSDTRNDRSHIYLDTDAGTVQMGSNFAASKMLQIDASSIAAATGGVNGDWSNFASLNIVNKSATSVDPSNNKTDAAFAKSVAASSTIAGVDTLSNRLDSGESARKITYLSPKISGLQVGLSFAPDLNNTGTGTALTKDSAKGLYMGLPVRVKNLWSMGLKYSNNFNEVDVALAAVADKGTAARQDLDKRTITVNGKTATLSDSEKFRDLKTYSLGGKVGTQGVTLALSYHNDGQSLTLVSQDRFKSSWWTTGVSYKQGNMFTSLTYLSGKKGSKNNGPTLTTKVISLGAEYEVVPGLKPYAEVTAVSMKPKNVSSDDSKGKATVFIIGTKLKF